MADQRAVSVLPGRAGGVYVNIHGESPVGGHLRMDCCRAI